MILAAEDLEYLSDDERNALTKWQENRNRPPLSTFTSGQFYQLFLNGNDCQEICRLNENLYPLGIIIEARVAHAWDRRKAEHLSNLYDGISERAKQTQLQSVAFVSDMLAATAKLHGDKVKRFLQTGDENEIKDLPIKSLDSYRKLIEMLLKLTGADSKSKPESKTNINIMAPMSSIKVDPKDENMTSEVAGKILALLEAKDGGD